MATRQFVYLAGEIGSLKPEEGQRAGESRVCAPALNFNSQGKNMAVHAEGSNVSDGLNQLHSNDRSVYLSIKPIDDDAREFYCDTPRGNYALIPTERFLVQWNGPRERFTKEVVGVKALFDLLRPIFSSHARCKRERDAFFAKKDREVLLSRQREIQAKIDTCKKTLAGLEKDLAALG